MSEPEAYGKPPREPARASAAARMRGRDAEKRRDDGLRFTRRVYPPRVIGLALGLPPALVVLWESASHPFFAAWVTFFCLVWPHIGYRIARASADPRRVEVRNLLADSAMGGMTIAMIDFSLLPSVLFVAMLAMDKFSAGGLALFWRGLAVQVVACAVTALAVDASFRPETSFITTIACIPLLLGYPAIVSHLMHRLARRINARARALAAMSHVDEATGLPDRTHWEQRVAAEMRRAQRTGRPASVLMLEIDGFRALLDERGPRAADDVVTGVADLLRRGVRAYDTSGRCGTATFGVAVPEIAGRDALELAERVRARVESSAFGPVALRCSVSVGLVNVVPVRATPMPDVIARAEAALRDAKAAGGNWIVTARPD